MSSEACYLCQSTASPKVFSVVGDTRFFKCPHCGLVWLERKAWPQNQRQHYSEEYYPEGYVGGDESLEDLFSYRFKPLKQYFKPEGKLLEVGAASGDFLHLLQDVGYEVSGVELSSRAAEQASRKYHLALAQGTLEEAAFPDNTFAYVVMYHVLEHIPDPVAALREVHRILKPGGRVLIEVPNIKSLDALSRPLLLSMLDAPNHLYAFSPKTLTRVVRSAGLTPRALERSFPFLISNALQSTRTVSKHPESEVLSPKEEASGKELFAHAHADPFLKKVIARILPGMKLTIIAEKAS